MNQGVIIMHLGTQIKTILILGFLMMSGIILFGCQGYTQVSYDAVTDMVTQTVSYATYANVDSDLTSVDIHTRETFGNAPVMMFIHGGSLEKGDKSNRTHLAKTHHFVGAGYVFVNVNYRLYPDMTYPENIKDIADAIRLVHETIGLYGGDPENIHLMGHSAGAYLAVLVSTNSGYLDAVGGSTAWISSVTVLDTDALVELPDWVTRTLPDPSWTIDATPFEHISWETPIPPMLFVINDGRSPSTVLSMIDRLESHGYHGGYVVSTGDDHNAINSEMGGKDDPKTTLVMMFLENPSDVGALTESLDHRI
jgi:arylformamidase